MRTANSVPINREFKPFSGLLFAPNASSCTEFSDNFSDNSDRAGENVHAHKAAGVENALALSSCLRLEAEFCHCRAFRPAGCDRWVEPLSLPEPNELPLTEAARYLHVSAWSLEQLLAMLLLPGEAAAK
jgi:hypothetical protein